MKDTWNGTFAAGKGTFQESVIEAVWAVIGKDGTNGISFYHTVDKDKLNQIGQLWELRIEVEGGFQPIGPRNLTIGIGSRPGDIISVVFSPFVKP